MSLDEPEQRGKDKYGNPRFVTPFEQAKWYADNMPRSISPRWLVTCNFDAMRIYDLNEELSETPEKSIERVVADDFLGIRRSTMDAICRALDCQPGDLLKYEAK